VIGGKGLLGGRHGAELVQTEPLLGEEAKKAIAARRIEQAVSFGDDGFGIERTIGRKKGTGGSAGVAYLASTLFNPFLPDLWDIRGQL
jgi:hypothetical protein